MKHQQHQDLGSGCCKNLTESDGLTQRHSGLVVKHLTTKPGVFDSNPVEDWDLKFRDLQAPLSSPSSNSYPTIVGEKLRRMIIVLAAFNQTDRISKLCKKIH